jgi:uncharacterized protein (TIGR03435 family)
MIPAVANHLWQSTIFAAFAGLVCLTLRRRPARVRHGIWLAASLKFLVPFSLLVGIGHQAAPRTPLLAVSPRVAAAIDDAAPIFAGPGGASAPKTAPKLPWIWLCGFLALASRSISRWRRVHAIARDASPLALAIPIDARSSPAPIEPGVFGIMHPVLLLPEGLAGRLSPAGLRAILAHELCHVRHRDNLAALLHTAVEAIFWFHPLVWFIGARLIDERERACDEEVLRLGNEADVYAGSILNACRQYLVAQASRPVLSAATGADLRKRVERILTDGLPRRLGFGGKVLLAVAGFAAVAGPLAIGLLHAQGRPAFEVASVKINRTGQPMGRYGPVDRSRFSAVNIPLAGIVADAYDVNFEQISGWPEWAHTERFDIEAKPEHPVDRQEMKAMLQTLLAERFHLVLRRETREQPIYALTLDRGGARLKAHATAAEPRRGDRMPIRPGDKGQVIFNGVEMERLAWFLGTRLQRRVVDRTGLAGSFDFELEWDGDRRREEFGGALAEPGPTVFSALHDLGLKLESQRGPVEFLTIEHLERPTEN